jgi:hypothetical protein
MIKRVSYPAAAAASALIPAQFPSPDWTGHSNVFAREIDGCGSAADQADVPNGGIYDVCRRAAHSYD